MRDVVTCCRHGASSNRLSVSIRDYGQREQMHPTCERVHQSSLRDKVCEASKTWPRITVDAEHARYLFDRRLAGRCSFNQVQDCASPCFYGCVALLATGASLTRVHFVGHCDRIPRLEEVQPMLTIASRGVFSKISRTDCGITIRFMTRVEEACRETRVFVHKTSVGSDLNPSNVDPVRTRAHLPKLSLL